VEERRCATSELEGYLMGQALAHVVMETCTEAFRIAERARGYGHDVCIVPATLVRSLGVAQRGLKNDVRDARALSEASCRMAPADGAPALTLRRSHCRTTVRIRMTPTYVYLKPQYLDRRRSYFDHVADGTL
jgi:hypothetical protein